MKRTKPNQPDRRHFIRTSAGVMGSMAVTVATSSSATTLQATKPSSPSSPASIKKSPESNVFISGGSESQFPSAQAPGSQDGGYNILFILTDQEHYMGSDWPFPLPGHERLKKMGTFFENHHIAADMCSASRAVIYTGLHQPHNGIFDNAGVPYMQSLSPQIPTVGKFLRKIGYYPAYKGKFHLNTAMANENDPADIKVLFERLMDEHYGFYDYTGVGDFIEGALGGYQYDDITTAQAVQWLKSKGQSMADSKQPWFLAVNLVNPHDVMWVDTDLPGQKVQGQDAMLTILPAPQNKHYQTTWNNIPLQSTWQQPLDTPDRVPAHRIYHQANAVLTGMIPNEERPVRERQNFYFNSIRAVDQQIVTLLDQLDNLGLTQNTIIMFTSDHGELLSSHGGLTGKGTTTYKQQNHVPMIVVHPAIPGGQRCHELTSHIDIVPSIVGMTQKNTAPIKSEFKRLPGKDISELLKQPVNPTFSKNRLGVLFCYSQLMVHDPKFTRELYTVVKDKSVSRRDDFKKLESFPIDWTLRVCIRSVTDERYTFSRYFAFNNFNTPETFEALLANNDLELYDLQLDPEELTNLAADPMTHQALIMHMNTKLNALIKQEIGVDDGTFLPLTQWIDWSNARVGMINI